MKILAVSDIHGSQGGSLAVEALIKEHEPDMVVIAGDITHFGPGEWAKGFLDSIELPSIAAYGNCDTEDVVEVLRKHPHGLLDGFRKVNGVNFLGLAYPFFKEFEQRMVVDVIVSHVPPMGCNDSVPGPGSIGDKNFRDFVIKHRPGLVLSGHVHESPGIAELEGTTCVNPGPAKDRRGAVIDIHGKKVKARLVHVG